MRTSNRINWVVAILGVWEIIAPFVLGYVTVRPPFWNNIIFGAALLVLSVWSALSASVTVDRTLDWIDAVIGIWLIVAPFVLGYTTVTAALWNDIIVGIVVVVLSAWAALSVRTPVVEEHVEQM